MIRSFPGDLFQTTAMPGPGDTAVLPEVALSAPETTISRDESLAETATPW